MISKQEIKKNIAEGWLLSKVIVELVGKPKKHVNKTLKDYIKAMPKDSLIITREELHEAKKHEGNLFAAFADLDILFKNLNELVYFCFDYMPSSVEVYEPSEMVYKAQDITDFINDLQGRLHDVDMTVKQLRQQNNKLNEGFTKMVKNFVVVSCVAPKTIRELEKIVGLEKKFVQIVIDALVKEKRIKKDKDRYKTLK